MLYARRPAILDVYGQGRVKPAEFIAEVVSQQANPDRATGSCGRSAYLSFGERTVARLLKAVALSFHPGRPVP